MTENANEQSTLTLFSTVEEAGDEYRCTVCGRTAKRRPVVKHCHPQPHLSRIRDAGVTAETDSHHGFVYPQTLHPAVREFFTAVETAIQDCQATPLYPAAEVILEEGSNHEFPSERVRVFAHLVFLQQHQVLPGYPVTVEASETNTISLERFITETDQVEGEITANELASSNVLSQERIYRAIVYSTTDEFVSKSRILPDSLWACRTERRFAEEMRNTDVIFGEGAAHNAVTAVARNWLATHPAIDWTCAPHVMTSMFGEQQCTLPTDNETSQPSPEPTMMFDFAGFREQNTQQLAVVGFVIDSEPHSKLAEQLARSSQPDALSLLVFPNRRSIIEFLDYADSVGILPDDAAPIDDVGEYYRRRPSIPDINAELHDRLGGTKHIFLSRKQLLDEIIDPVRVLPDELPPCRE